MICSHNFSWLSKRNSPVHQTTGNYVADAFTLVNMRRQPTGKLQLTI